MEKLTFDDQIEIVDYWFKKTYNKSIMELTEEERKSPDFYKIHPVSKELYDEWYAWAKEYCRNKTGLSKKMIDRSFWSINLNLAPSVIE